MNKMERNKKEVVDVINDLNHIYPIWLKKVGKYDKTVRRIESSVKILESELKDVARLVTQSNCSSKFTISGQVVTSEKKTKAFSTYIPKGFDVFALAHLNKTGSLNRYLKRKKKGLSN
nr:hypothetical protein [Moritella viscosa]